jgi:phosphocarrier protein HPr
VIEREGVIVNSLGMHARPAAQVVRLASTFGSEIELECDGQTVNGKSIMGVMMLAAEQGATVHVRATGSDEEVAAQALVDLIATGFGEQ